MLAGLPKVDPLPKPGVNDDAGPRPLGAFAAGVVLEFEPPAMELHAKSNVLHATNRASSENGI